MRRQVKEETESIALARAVFRRFRCWLQHSNVEVCCSWQYPAYRKMRYPMLEPYASKGARPVRRGGSASNGAALPDLGPRCVKDRNQYRYQRRGNECSLRRV